MDRKPLPPDQARRRIRAILETGIVTYAIPHALERLRQRNISIVDCENVLRGGWSIRRNGRTAPGATRSGRRNSR